MLPSSSRSAVMPSPFHGIVETPAWRGSELGLGSGSGSGLGLGLGSGLGLGLGSGSGSGLWSGLGLERGNVRAVG
eukprot:scaffold102196_cov21-Phaeocystis_antarctica.AAC.1